jgi:hypothetical protein
VESGVTGTVKPTRLERTQRFLTHVGRFDPSWANEMLSPRVSYQVAGHHALAGTFSGRDQVLRHLSNVMDVTGGTFDPIKWEDWLVGERHVATIADIRITADHRTFAGRMIYLLGFDDGDLIVSIRAFFEDEDAAEQFLGPATPGSYAP